MPKDKGYARPAGDLSKKGKSQFFNDPTPGRKEEGLGKSFRVKRNPSS